MIAIIKRELQSYFRTFIGYLFVAVTLFFLGMYFVMYNLLQGRPYFSYMVSGAVSVLLISIPVLTMKVLAEERKNRTDQLILTAPVSVFKIVFGKFIALCIVYLIPVGIACLFPVILGRFGSFPMGMAYLALFGFYLYGIAAISLGLFVSGLTDNQIVAAVMGFVVIFLGYIMSGLTAMISDSHKMVIKFLGCFDMAGRFNRMLSGTLEVGAIVYFLTIIALALYASVFVIEKRRYNIIDNKPLAFCNIATGLLFVGSLILLNLCVGELPEEYANVDLTHSKLYTLSETTKEYISGVDRDITLYVYADETSCDRTVDHTLKRFEDLSGFVNVVYVNPTTNPLFYEKYSDTPISNNSVVVECAGKNRVVDYNELYKISYDYEEYKVTGKLNSSVTGYDAEGRILGAIDYCLNDNKALVYVLSGHGENKLSEKFMDSFEKLNVEYKELDLMRESEIDPKASVIVINAPTADITEAEA
ncbi:MAG: Gldg family protein, partial [Lachnospiraceae bacterium]|nr:Gldg family protein [Lachnospiraceae bacterium]